MTTTLTIIHNAVTAKIIDAPKDVKLVVQELLSYKIDGFVHTTAFKEGRWNGRSSFFEWPEAKFPRGFLTIVHAKLIGLGYRVNVVKKPLPTPLGPEKPVVDSFPEDPRYDYQRHVVDKLLYHGQIIAQVSTGGGKSRIAKLCFARINRPTLFLTTRGILMHQMANAMRELVGPHRVGLIGDGNWRYVDGFNAGMVQTFAAALKEPDPTEPADVQRAKYAEIAQVHKLLERFELVILEEAHESSGNSYYEILRLCANAHYRLALTATPFMKDSEEANMRLMASSGPVAIKVTEKMLIERGILAKPYFKIIRLEDASPECLVEKRDPKGRRTGEMQVQKLLKSTPWPKCYEMAIAGGIKRNGIIVYEAKRAASLGLPVMILVQHQLHGERLQKMLTEAGVRCNFIFGKHEQEERQAALAALKTGRLDVVIGSTILDVGVDVPSLGMVIIASAGKAEVAMRQRIGRGLRAKKEGANVCYIIDFDDWQNNHLKDHSKQRRAILDQTEGFAEGVLKPGQDFDFAGHGFLKAA